MYIASYGWNGTQKKASFGNDSPREGDSLSWRIFCDRPCLRGRLPGGRQLGPQRPPSPHRMDRGNGLFFKNRESPCRRGHQGGTSFRSSPDPSDRQGSKRTIAYITPLWSYFAERVKAHSTGMGEELTTPLKEAKLGPGAENTKHRRTPPRQTSGFFCASSFPPFFIPLSFAGRAPNTRPFGEIKPPTYAGFQRPAPFCGVNPHRLKIEHRSLP